MPDVVIGSIVLVIVIVVAALCLRIYNGRITQAHDRHVILWKLQERTETDLDGRRVLAVYCVHPGDEDLPVGSARWGSADFDTTLEEVRVEGQMKLDVLNRPLLSRAANE
jgi:hypothetical protein